LEDSTRDKLKKNFDKVLLNIGNNALVDGVCWGFWDVEAGLVPFRATEFFALPDERTGSPAVGVRFWQIDKDKPLYISVYEKDGVTEYRYADNVISINEPKKAYITKMASDITGDRAIGIEVHDVLPIFPLYANELRQSEIVGLKGWIDAYDFVASDLVDGITFIDGIYSLVKNYGGNDLNDLVTEITERKIIRTDGVDSGADMKAIESPFMGKKESLEWLENRMQIDFMVPSQISGRAATATEINLAREPLDFKADIFEMQVVDFVENILKLLGIEDVEPKFNRRTTTNDTEITNNIVSMRGDLSLETALKLYPLVPDDMVEENMRQLAEEIMGMSGDEDDGE
jgi:hypothetical protein